MRVKFTILLLLTLNNTIFSQENNALINYNYTMFYNSNSTSVYMHRASAGYNARSLKYEFEIKSFTVDYPMTSTFITANLDNVLSLQGSVTYKKSIGRNTELNLFFAPRLNWLKNQSPGFKNIIPEAGFSFIRKLGETYPAYISFGVSYSTFFGKPAFIPVISFETSLEKLDIKAGIPETIVSYNISPEHSFNAWARSSSFYAENIEENYFYSGDTAQSIDAVEWLDISAGLGYKYTSNAGWNTILSVGKTLYNSFDISASNTSYEPGLDRNISVSLHLVYNLNLKK